MAVRRNKTNRDKEKSYLVSARRLATELEKTILKAMVSGDYPQDYAQIKKIVHELKRHIVHLESTVQHDIS